MGTNNLGRVEQIDYLDLQLLLDRREQLQQYWHKKAREIKELQK